MWLSLGRWWYRVWSLDGENGVMWNELFVVGGGQHTGYNDVLREATEELYGM